MSQREGKGRYLGSRRGPASATWMGHGSPEKPFSPPVPSPAATYALLWAAFDRMYQLFELDGRSVCFNEPLARDKRTEKSSRAYVAWPMSHQHFSACRAPDIAQERRIMRIAQAILTHSSELVLWTKTEQLLNEYGPRAGISLKHIAHCGRDGQSQDLIRQIIFGMIPEQLAT